MKESGCTRKQDYMIVDEIPLMMKVTMIFFVVRVVEIIIYFLLILFKFQLTLCYWLSLFVFNVSKNILFISLIHNAKKNFKKCLQNLIVVLHVFVMLVNLSGSSSLSILGTRALKLVNNIPYVRIVKAFFNFLLTYM